MRCYRLTDMLPFIKPIFPSLTLSLSLSPPPSPPPLPPLSLSFTRLLGLLYVRRNSAAYPSYKGDIYLTMGSKIVKSRTCRMCVACFKSMVKQPQKDLCAWPFVLEKLTIFFMSIYILYINSFNVYIMPLLILNPYTLLW